MNITEQPSTDELPLFHSNAARFKYWRSKLERFKTAQGMSALLGHVTEQQWHTHYAANEDAFTAVVLEASRVTD